MLGLTVLIVTHGRAHMLRRVFPNLAVQDRPHQVLVVDDGDDTGAVEKVCAEHGVPRVRREKQPGHDGYISPAAAFNFGLRHVQTPIVVMQGAEILYTRPTDLSTLSAPHEGGDDKLVTLATCVKLNKDGGTRFPKTTGRAPYTDEEGEHYPVHAGWNRNIYFVFGCCFRPSLLFNVGGFFEGYQGWGFEDEDMQRRLIHFGAKPLWFGPDEVLSQHQWHPDVPAARILLPEDRKLFEQRMGKLR